jgi:hypothetical protein
MGIETGAGKLMPETHNAQLGAVDVEETDMDSPTIEEKRRDDVLDLRDMLLAERRELSIGAAESYARRIIWAQLREEYEDMVRILNEALYKPEKV